MADSKTTGIGFFGLLFIVLLVLKLTQLATISWFWVFFPITLPFLILIVILVGALAVAGIAALLHR